jgi:hypothetical protein
MKKVILSAVFAAMILSISGCQDRQDYQERKQDYKKPDINRPGNPQRFEKF